jgi:surface protein
MSIVRLMQQAAAGGGAPAPEPDFLMTVTTTTSSEAFTIPCQNVGTFSCTVDWGDGTTSAVTAYNDADLAHTYATADDYQIRITGTFPNINFNNGGDKLKVKSVENLGTVGWTRLDGAFFGCSNMTSFVAGTSGTSSVTTMIYMFRGCSSLTTLDMSGFDTSSSTSMGSMFHTCSSVTSLDLSSFDTSSVTTMNRMFNGMTVLLSVDLSSFDTSIVTDMGFMFYFCQGITTINVSSFDTSSVAQMGSMLRYLPDLTDIIGVGDFDIGGLNGTGDLSSFANFTTIPTARYDDILIKWDAQDPFNGIAADFGNSTYTGGGTAAAARANLISTDGWTISDGGVA